MPSLDSVTPLILTLDEEPGRRGRTGGTEERGGDVVRPLWLGGRGGGLRAGAADPARRAAPSAARISVALANRFSLSFARARLQTATRDADTWGAQRRTGGACRWTTW